MGRGSSHKTSTCAVLFLKYRQTVEIFTWKINYKDTKAKCRYLNKLSSKGILRQGRGEGGDMNQREGYSGNSSQSWVEIPT
jgi:hypothetical protein